MNRNERKSKITSYKLLGISWYNCSLEELGNGNGNGKRWESEVEEGGGGEGGMNW